MKTKYHSYKCGKLSKGCSLCVKGRKSVLFVTGICPRRCFYCPISEKKKNKDVIYINEFKTFDFEEIINEIKLCSSRGIGITGGDPLSRLDRTINFIKLLKKEFGKDFHIHLYTSLTLVTKEKLSLLYNSGLDEIRFHVDLEIDHDLEKIKIFKNFKWDVGMEIPLIPGEYKKVKELLLYVKDYVDFVNLNELEFSDNEAYVDRGYKVKNSLSYAIKGSLEVGKKLLNVCEKERINCHVCTAKLKDSVQLRNRMKLRLKSVKKWYDMDLGDGILARGVVYLEKPSFNYEENIKKITSDSLLSVKGRLGFRCEVDEKKKRILTSIKMVLDKTEDIKNKGMFPAIVKEYASSDQFELEIDFL